MTVLAESGPGWRDAVARDLGLPTDRQRRAEAELQRLAEARAADQDVSLARARAETLETTQGRRLQAVAEGRE